MWIKSGIKFICIIIFCSFAQESLAKRLYSEQTYQHYWCNKYGGVTEFRLPDNTRVDCLLKDYAIEFDFASKWGEAIGQSLYYGLNTNKKAGVVLIMEDLKKDNKYLMRLSRVAKHHDITIWTITPEDITSYLSLLH